MTAYNAANYRGQALRAAALRAPGEIVADGRYSARYDPAVQSYDLYVEGRLLITLETVGPNHMSVKNLPLRLPTGTLAAEEAEIAEGFVR